MSTVTTGLCRVCGERRTLNKRDRVTRHFVTGNQLCHGSHVGPVADSIYCEEVEDKELEPVIQTIPMRIAHMQEIINQAIPETSEDMLRARRTLAHFESRNV